MSKPDPLKTLLRAADAQAGPPPRMPPNLVARVRQGGARRHRAARWVWLVPSAAAALVLLAVTLYTRPGTPPGASEPPVALPPVVPAPVEATKRSELDGIRLAADSRAAVAEELLRLEGVRARIRAPLAQVSAPDIVGQVEQERERAAQTLVTYADRLERELNLRESAVANYRSALRLFPETAWAVVARARLAILD